MRTRKFQLCGHLGPCGPAFNQPQLFAVFAIVACTIVTIFKLQRLQLQPGCRIVSNNGSGSGLAPAQNILAV